MSEPRTSVRLQVFIARNCDPVWQIQAMHVPLFIILLIRNQLSLGPRCVVWISLPPPLRADPRVPVKDESAEVNKS